MLKDVALRKKMSELGISSQGPRQLLELRHKEWITIWNANCDSVRPKSRAALLQDLGTWERLSGAAAAGMAFGRTRAGVEIKDKDFDGAAWSSKHDTGFRDLIASARANAAKARKQKEGREKSAEEPPPEIPSEPSAVTTPSMARHDVSVEDTPSGAEQKSQQPPAGPQTVGFPSPAQA